MTRDELRVKAAELMGLNVVHTSWPCGRPPDSCRLEADQMPIKCVDGWGTDSPDWYDKKCPVHLVGHDEYWPPKWCEDHSDWMTAVQPVPDYPNDIAAALELFSVAANAHREYEMAEELFPSVCDFIQYEDGDMPGTSDVVSDLFKIDARAITSAFVFAMTQDD